jgi:hypothetical protein
MHYLALLYGNEATGPTPGTPSWEAQHQQYQRFNEVAGSAIRGGAALQPAASGVTIRPGRSGAMTTAGPFTETAEVIGGVYVLEVDDLDRAVDLAGRIPMAHRGAVEVRPVVDWYPPATGAPGVEGRPRWLALVWNQETAAEQPGTPEWDAGGVAHGQFLGEAGDRVDGGASLHPGATGTTVRVRGEQVLVTDGPFAETREVIGGFYLFAPMPADEAAALAQRIPVRSDGAIELRPILEVG